VRVRDGRDVADVRLRGSHERQWHYAHERPVPVVAYAIHAMAGLECSCRGPTHVEDAANGVLAVVEPMLEPSAHVIDVYAAELPIAVACRKGHARIIGPRSRRLVMRPVSGHPCASERPAWLELVGDTECIADCLPVHGVADSHLRSASFPRPSRLLV